MGHVTEQCGTIHNAQWAPGWEATSFHSWVPTFKMPAPGTKDDPQVSTALLEPGTGKCLSNKSQQLVLIAGDFFNFQKTDWNSSLGKFYFFFSDKLLQKI